MGRTAAATGTVVGILALVIQRPGVVVSGSDQAQRPAGPNSQPPQRTITIPSIEGQPDPNIELDPSSGGPGSRVTVTGTGFPANAEVEIMFHLTKIGETRSDGSGGFEVEVRIPTNIQTKNFPWSIIARSSVYADEEQFQVT